MPLPTYLFAMLTTSLRLASHKRCLASSSPASILLARLISSSAVSKATLPISFKYIRTGSSTAMPFGRFESSSPSLSSATTFFFTGPSVSGSSSVSPSILIINKLSGSTSASTSIPWANNAS